MDVDKDVNAGLRCSGFVNGYGGPCSVIVSDHDGSAHGAMGLVARDSGALSRDRGRSSCGLVAKLIPDVAAFFMPSSVGRASTVEESGSDSVRSPPSIRTRTE